MGKIIVEITEEDVKKYISKILAEHYNIAISPKDVVLLVRSKQNYRDQEWERGELKFTIEKSI